MAQVARAKAYTGAATAAPSGKRFLGMKAAAEYVGVCQSTMNKWIHEYPPRIPYYFDGIYRFAIADLDKYLASIYVKGGEEAV